MAAVLLLVKAELADTVADRVEASGVMVIAKPVSRQVFEQAQRFALAARNRLTALHAENERLEKKMAELRLIDRAKCVLIQYLGMTEQQAHRHIEKQAMDTRRNQSHRRPKHTSYLRDVRFCEGGGFSSEKPRSLALPPGGKFTVGENSGGEAASLREAPLPQTPSPEEQHAFGACASAWVVPPVRLGAVSDRLGCGHGG